MYGGSALLPHPLLPKMDSPAVPLPPPLRNRPVDVKRGKVNMSPAPYTLILSIAQVLTVVVLWQKILILAEGNLDGR